MVVDEDSVHFLGQKIAHRATDNGGLPVEAEGAFSPLQLFLYILPGFQEQVEIADKIPQFLALARRADDNPHPVRNGDSSQDFAQACPLRFIFDLAGDPALVVFGHEHQKSPW